MKYLILGDGRHGKDTAAEIITELTGLSFMGSSMAACEKVVFPQMKGYRTVQGCYEDRVNWREKWFELIQDYNSAEPDRLCREILAEHDGYVGMRCAREYEAARRHFGMIIWVNAYPRVPLDPTMKIKWHPGMVTVHNVGPVDELRKQLEELFR